MKWNKSSIQQYVEAKEYIDTLLIPLIPLQLTPDKDLEKNAFQRELLGILAHEIEKDLAGRMMLIPDYVYLKESDKTQEKDRLNQWVNGATKQPFKHIFFITFDSLWKKHEQSLDGTLLWLPGMQSGDLRSGEMHTIIRDQVEQISELIRSYWT
ncbi:MAG TPA: DUF2487 family protein [Virgibacillus sp.]|nr:DUF2487 family protein [Virgibacillus sp.]